MASPLRFLIESAYNPKGTDDAARALNNLAAQTQQTAAAARDIGKAFDNVRRVLVGAALTLPLAGFVRQAIASEEATARWGLQLESLGQSISDVNIEALSKSVRDLAGVTQTELVSALATGLKFFKDTTKELEYLNTAIGITKVSGVSLSQAFQQIGQVQLGYGSRVARQYGISMHREIEEPTKRAAAILEDLRKRMEPLARQTGTTSESLKILGANIRDIGETIGSEFIAPIGEIAKAFNRLDDSTKELIIRTVLYTTAVYGLATAYGVLSKSLAGTAISKTITDLSLLATLPVTLKELPTLFTLIGQSLKGLGATVIVAASIALVVRYVQAVKDWGNELDAAAAKEAAINKKLSDASTARLTDLGKEISATEDLTLVIGELKDEYDLLALRVGVVDKKRGGASETILREKEIAKQRLDGAIALQKAIEDVDAKGLGKIDEAYKIATQGRLKFEIDKLKEKYEATINNENLIAKDRQKFLAVYGAQLDALLTDELRKQNDIQRNIAGLRISLMKDGLEKELAARRLMLLNEREAFLSNTKDSMEARKLLAEKYSKDERDIRIKYAKQALQEELDFALRTKEEQAKFTIEYETAQALLRQKGTGGIKSFSDTEKEILKTEGGRKSLNEQLEKSVERRAKAATSEAEVASRIAASRKEDVLDAEKAKLAKIEESIAAWEQVDAAKEITKERRKEAEIQRAKVADLEKELALMRETGSIGIKRGKDGTFEAKVASQASQVELQSNITVNITPSVGELVNKIKQVAGEETQRQLAEWENTFRTINQQ